MRIVSWNAKVGRADDDFGDALANLIGDLNPDVICLQEAEKYVNVMRNRFEKNWWTYACTNDCGWDESAMCPVMVDKRFDKKSKPDGWNVVRTKTVWTGPQGNDHKGRTWTWVKVDGRYIMSLHRCTGGQNGNRDASKEEASVLKQWINSHDADGGRVIVLGDHNFNPKDQTPAWSSWNIAHDVSGSVRFDANEVTVDYAICRNQKAKTVERKGAYGSDHHAILFVTED